MNIKKFFDCIMVGNSSVINSENIKMLNDRALALYNTPELNSDEVEELKQLIMICNVLYNRTDMTVLPIEDGFYDLLLEKYKKYDKNFQVGSAVVDFRNFIENDIDNPRKVAVNPLIFAKEIKKRDEIQQALHEDIALYHKGTLRPEDFYQVPISFSNQYVSKRTHDTEHNHPSLVGTLDKAKFVTNQDAINAGVFDDPDVVILERDFFQKHVAKGIIRPDQTISVVCELKYDGISVEADCGFTLSSARTRGDTGMGVASDITPILKGYTFKNAHCMIGEKDVGCKFEAIMTKSNLAKFNQIRGRSYANCRSAIVGLFGASDAYLFRDMITLVPLALDRENFEYKISNRLEEIEFLNRVFVSHGQPLRYSVFTGTLSDILYLIKVFWDEAQYMRDYLDFMYDGIVVSYLDEGIRNTLGRENYINKYSMAVKFDPLQKQTIFRGYTYEVGQHGNITPMIHYDPVEFLGTIHTKSSGSSYNRFQELGLRYGDVVTVTYRNDVMPYVTKTECKHNRENQNPLEKFIEVCPICGTPIVLSDSGKTAICPNIGCIGRSIQRMVNMFAKLNIKGFSDAAFNALAEFDHLYKLFQVDLNSNFYIDRLGNADGIAFVDALKHILNDPWQDSVIIGSIGFTGIANKKWQSILSSITLRELNDLYLSSSNPDEFRFKIVARVPNIGEATANTIANEWSFFEPDIALILNSVHLSDTMSRGASLGEIRFTGFRNSQLAEQLNTLGYDASDSAVTKKTNILLIPYEGFTSSKVAKAKTNPDTKIIPVQDFIDNSDKYIGVKL